MLFSLKKELSVLVKYNRKLLYRSIVSDAQYCMSNEISPQVFYAVNLNKTFYF